MQQSSSLSTLSPERNQTPKYPLAVCQLLHNHLETAFLNHGDEFIIGHRHKSFFPAPMFMSAFPLGSMFDTLHRPGKAENLRSASKMLQPHELIAAIPTSVPRFVTKMFQPARVKLDVVLKIWTTDLSECAVKLLCGLQDGVKFMVCKFEGSHIVI